MRGSRSATGRWCGAVGLGLTAALPAGAQTNLFPRQGGALGSTEQVAVSGVLEHPSVAPGEETTLAIVLDIADEWHTYWRNPGDSGAPIDVAFLATEGAEVGELQWPAPERYIYSDGQSLDYVYEHRAVLLAPVRVHKDAKPGSKVTISVNVEYLVCREACIPGDASLEVTLDIAAPGEASIDASAGELFTAARALLPQEEPALAADGIVVQWAGMTLMLLAPGAEAGNPPNP